MADYIPEGVIINILQRLHTKTLIRCTSVCKSWYILITSPQFISTHLNFNACTRKTAPLLLLRRRIRNAERYTLHSDTKSFNGFGKLNFPFKSTSSYFNIIGSCNGLLCLSDDLDDYMHTVVIWNPCVRKSVLLPKPNLICYVGETFGQSYGFGYDCIANDYKVVRISSVVNDDGCSLRVELYKLSTGVWQDVSDVEPADVVVTYSESRQAYVRGANHWIAHFVFMYDLIVLFDMSNEVCREMSLPKSLKAKRLMEKRDLMVYMESLALVTWVHASRFCVWVMTEYGVVESWTKHFNVNIFGGGFSRPLWVRGSDEVIAICEDGRLVSCGSNDGGEETDLNVCCGRSDYSQLSVHMESYTKSLVLLDRGPGFCDAATCSRLTTLQAEMTVGTE